MYADNFSAINEFKLSSKGKEVFKLISKMKSFNVDRIPLERSQFDILLNAVIPSCRGDCEREIPFYGKKIVMKN